MVLNILKILSILGILVQTFSCVSLDFDNPNDPRNSTSSGKGKGDDPDGPALPSGSSSFSGSSSSSSSFSCDQQNIIDADLTVDYHDEAYKTVVICNQTWMAKNLNYYVEGSECYDDEPENCETYGRLYNWATAMGINTSYNTNKWNGSDVKHRGICPENWHIPSDDEWTTLTNYVGSNAGTKLKTTSGWSYFDGSYRNGTDEFDFAALPGGFTSETKSYSVGYSGSWWSATENGSDKVWFRAIDHYSDVSRVGDGNKKYLRSIRCIKD